jgi:hypothetical protein
MPFLLANIKKPNEYHYRDKENNPQHEAECPP